MKRKGFTLIELLAVIVILAVIALIAVPVMLNVIERARKGAFEDTAYGVVDAAKLYYADASLDGGVSTETFTFPEDTKLKLSGTKPESGSVVLGEDGSVELAISNGTWCAVKNKDEERVTITDYSIGGCEIGGVQEPDVPVTAETCFTVSEVDASKITGYTCTDIKDVVIPSSINGVEVKSIGEVVFADNQLTSIKIPNTIMEIGTSAFESNQLTNVVISENVTSIGDGAFMNNQLTSVNIPNKVSFIGDFAFANNQLTSVRIPEMHSIHRYAFYGNQLTSVNIPNVVQSIGEYAFANNQLTSVEISDNIIGIGEDAFAGNNDTMQIIINKARDSVEGSPWGASSVEWRG